MALFSFRHSVRTFSAKRTAEARAAQVGQTAAHLRYITRPTAARLVASARLAPAQLPEVARQAEANAQRRKGRVAERFIVALPVEATQDQREALARAFCERLTAGKAGYVVALHDRHGNDSANPHFHAVAFDAFERSGGRGRPRSVLGMARKGAVEGTAKMWADLHNEMMRGWGYGRASMISHLSLAARGGERLPTIHEGPGARAMAKAGKTPQAKPEWASLDEGHTRAEANALIREINHISMEMNDARDRLGRHDEEDAPACRAGRPPFGADCGRDERPPRRESPPFASAERCEETERDGGRAPERDRPRLGADERVPPAHGHPSGLRHFLPTSSNGF